MSLPLGSSSLAAAAGVSSATKGNGRAGGEERRRVAMPWTSLEQRHGLCLYDATHILAVVYIGYDIIKF